MNKYKISININVEKEITAKDSTSAIDKFLKFFNKKLENDDNFTLLNDFIAENCKCEQVSKNKPMKIRIISDLHLDINNDNIKIPNNDIFTIIAGDISGNNFLTTDWINSNIKEGLFIAGNHIVYNNRNKTVYELKAELAENFPLENKVSFLDYTTGICKEINGYLFIGTTLYTDYKQKGTKCSNNMKNALYGLNDFYYGKINHHGDNITPEYYKAEFHNSLNEIESIVNANKNKEIIVITHHCPSFKSIGEKYKYSNLNMSYASNLESFIKKHPNIKCWICGHCHNRAVYKIEQCLVIQNPRGYISTDEDLGWTPNYYLNTKDWTIEEQPWEDKNKDI